MTLRMNSQGINNESDVHGFRSPPPGRYHVLVEHVDDTFEKGDWIAVEFKVLAGTVPGQEGLKHTENMFLENGGASEKHLRFALATGLINPGTEADVDLKHAIGRQCIIGLEKRKAKNSDREYTNIADYGMAIWSLTNPEVTDVPRAAASPQGMPAPQQGYQQQPPAQQQPQYQQPPQQQTPPQQYQQPSQGQPQAQQYAPPPQQQPAPPQQAPPQGGGNQWSDI